MDKDENLGSIVHRIAAEERRWADVSCPSDQHSTDLRRRVFGNGSVHFVQQCVRCGEQVGGPVKRPSHEPHDFDFSIKERRNNVLATLTALRLERARVGGPEVCTVLAPFDTRRRAQESVDFDLERHAKEFGEEAALQLYMQRIWTRMEARRQKLAGETDRFCSERELHSWVKTYLSEDFILHHEVQGRHLAEKSGVRIDFIAYPKQHLIEAGYDDSPFGIEVKFIDPLNGFTRQASRGFWQTITYTDSEFGVGNQIVRPRYAILLSNLAFDAERALLKPDDVQQWRAFINLAHHARTWRLEIRGTKSKFEGWTVMCSSNAYFSRKDDFGRYGTGQVIYTRSTKMQIWDVPRVGNF